MSDNPNSTLPGPSQESENNESVAPLPQSSGAIPKEVSNNSVRNHLLPISRSQAIILEREFRLNPFITKRRKEELVFFLDMPEQQIELWFQNRRIIPSYETNYYPILPVGVGNNHMMPPVPGTSRLLISPQKRQKRFRSSFTTEQINALEDEYRTCNYVDVKKREDMSRQLNIPPNAIKIWFQNRRMKEKKELEDAEELKRYWELEMMSAQNNMESITDNDVTEADNLLVPLDVASSASNNMNDLTSNISNLSVEQLGHTSSMTNVEQPTQESIRKSFRDIATQTQVSRNSLATDVSLLPAIPTELQLGYLKYVISVHEQSEHTIGPNEPTPNSTKNFCYNCKCFSGVEIRIKNDNTKDTRNKPSTNLDTNL